jgi:lecithin:retinol acyltransferase
VAEILRVPPDSSLLEYPTSGPAERPASGLRPEPSPGAHLTTSRGGYTHHGVYVGNGRVVHYAGFSRLWHSGPVEEVSLCQFADGCSVHVVDHHEAPYSAEEIVRRARSRLGEDAYRLLTNNCEHLCNWCITGVSRSAQVERRLTFPLQALFAAARIVDSASRRFSVARPRFGRGLGLAA